MRVRNISNIDYVALGFTIKQGEDSGDIPDALARRIVGENPTMFALAPESAHEPEELAHADEPATVRFVRHEEPADEPEDEPVRSKIRR